MVNKIFIRIDTQKYNLDILKEVLKIEFEDEFEFEFEDHENCLSIHDYIYSTFKYSADYDKSEQRIRNVIENIDYLEY